MPSFRQPLVRWFLAVLLAAGLTACGSSGTGGVGEASCAAVVEYDGAAYYGYGDLRRDPTTTGRVARGVVPSCDDSGGQVRPEPARTVELAELTGVPLETAVLLNGSVYIREGHDLPAAAARWFRAPRCATRGEFTVTADWLGVSGPKKPRYDGDLRPPYRLEVRVTEGPSRYVGTTITVRADADTRPALGPRDVEASLWEGGQVVARVRCEAGHFEATSLRVPAS